MRILLVEDDPDIASMVVTGLSEAGHAVDHAANGALGLSIAQSERFDAIIMDRRLPGDIDGADVARALRSRDTTTPVLFLSSLSELGDFVKGLDSGADDYMTKPFVFTELLSRLEALRQQAVVKSV